MREFNISTSYDLESIFNQFGSQYLYRGQTKHYVDSNNIVSIPTSIDRHGCIPSTMFKWTHYAKSLIRIFSSSNYHSIDTGVTQAILQHYGWRSFFVDLTTSSAVAAWFAANKYNDGKSMQLHEDFEENPVWLINNVATYIESNDPGHIYIIDPQFLIEKNLKIYNLSLIECEDGLLRFHSQKACLVEGDDGKLPSESVIAHLTVPHNILLETYRNCGIEKVEDIFPNRDRDFILRCLLDIPWEQVQTNSRSKIPVYQRGLELPEYDYKYVKHLGSQPTLFNGFWIADNRGSANSPFVDIPFVRLPQISYFANANSNFNLSAVNQFLNANPIFIIELDNLVKVHELADPTEFEKGIVVEKIETNLISVSGLILNHPGHVVEGAGISKGWFYRCMGEHWTRIDHPEQCPCNDDLRHILQFSILSHLNEFMLGDEIIKIDSKNYWHRDIANS